MVKEKQTGVMTVVVYEVPIHMYNHEIKNGKIPHEILDKYGHVVTSGGSYKEVLRELVASINQDTVDEINNYLYINEDL